MKKFIFPKDTMYKELRDKHKLTQAAMAEILDISQPAYHHLERGDSWPSFEVISNTMEAFNVPFKRFREYYTERKREIEGAATK